MVRKLKREEHESTKSIYTNVFPEDTPEFVDYYYKYVTANNSIYTIEDKAMLHLNPYKVKVFGALIGVNYIVAVATLESYRKQGYMRRIILKALTDMYEQGQVFTYLMPAAEAIYTPYDFRVISKQSYYKLEIPDLSEHNFLAKIKEHISYGRSAIDTEGFSVRWATDNDCKELETHTVSIQNGNTQIYTIKDRSYFQRLIKEQEAQNGGVLLIHDQNKLVGSVVVAMEGEIILRDLLLSNTVKIPVSEVKQQNMMARIVDVMGMLKILPEEIRIKLELNEFLLVDEILMGQTGHYKYSESTYKFTKIAVENMEKMNPCRVQNKADIYLDKNEKREMKKYTLVELTECIFLNTEIVLNEIV